VQEEVMSTERLCLICGARVTNMNQKTETCGPQCTEHLKAGRLTQKSRDAYLRRFSTDYEGPPAPMAKIHMSADGTMRPTGT
jgi:hypothetical protein